MENLHKNIHKNIDNHNVESYDSKTDMQLSIYIRINSPRISIFETYFISIIWGIVKFSILLPNTQVFIGIMKNTPNYIIGHRPENKNSLFSSRYCLENVEI